jgi:putative cardiolipin synthase
MENAATTFRHSSKSWRSGLLSAVLALVLLLPGIGSSGSLDQENPFSIARISGEIVPAHPGRSGAYVLERGEESLLARAWLADHARYTIAVQYFIWSTDNIGTLAAEALLRAAERGVRVRVIVDDLLVDASEESLLALSAHPNIDIRIYNPKHSVGVSTPQRASNLVSDFRAFNQRMHDKTFMVDGTVAITGGRNMADEYYDFHQKYNFRDRDVLLLGPVVREMEQSFEAFWQSPLSAPIPDLLQKRRALSSERTEEIYTQLHAYAGDPANFAPEVRQALEDLPEKFPDLLERLAWEEVRFISDTPGKNGNAGLDGGGQITRELMMVLSQARQRITIQSPYLVMPEGGIEFFRELVERGVDVSISTNSLASTDNLQAFSGYSKQRKELLAAGIKVYEFRPDPAVRRELIERHAELENSAPIFAIHAKTLVVDGRTLFIGTFNLDPRSANLNTEVGVLISDAGLAGEVEDSIRTDMRPENSWDAGVDDPDAQASLAKRVKLRFWKLFPLEPIL